MFKRRRIRLDEGLYLKARAQADSLNYACVDDFVIHVLERELAKVGTRQDAQLAERRLRGLGYIE